MDSLTGRTQRSALPAKGGKPDKQKGDRGRSPTPKGEKGKYCFEFAKSGSCQRGKDCPWPHVREERKKSTDKGKGKKKGGGKGKSRSPSPKGDRTDSDGVCRLYKDAAKKGDAVSPKAAAKAKAKASPKSAAICLAVVAS